jgi:methionyl-tRNA formyltransferase
MHQPLAITNTDTASSLHNKLAKLGSAVLVDALNQLQFGQLQSIPQNDHGICYARKLVKAEGIIDWNQTATQIALQVRGLNPWPVCYSNLRQHCLRIWSARSITNSVHQPPGTLLKLDDQGLLVACGQGCLLIDKLQWPGNKVMIATQLINLQQKLPLGACFT